MVHHQNSPKQSNKPVYKNGIKILPDIIETQETKYLKNKKLKIFIAQWNKEKLYLGYNPLEI